MNSKSHRVSLMLAGILIMLALLCFFSSVEGRKHLTRLPRLNIAKQSFGVSGLSAGAFMAVQFQVAFSKSIVGAGVVAGGPFFCSMGNVLIALNQCMRIPELIDLALMNDIIQGMSMENLIDDTSNLRNHRMYLFSGLEDAMVVQGVMRKLQTQLTQYFNMSRIVSDWNVPAEHAMITNDYGNACNFLGEPWINNCGMDVAGKILSVVMGAPISKNGTTPIDDNLYTFSQSGNYSAMSFDDKGYVYIPTACQGGRAQCAAHLVFHGCNQGARYIGETFVLHSGYLKHAEANNIVVIFPQVKKEGFIEPNPQGCFDWWGYSGIETFATKSGVQMRAIANMMNDLGVQIF
ncbi:hypothetical protein C9374_009499 [Naegleria lovaniensis]|uniref:Poly(3-hydroxybutyrate) depolymerase n=1 Tax=Naegleria lovaniensis TaxID=51637 RepID=A0AA88H4W2_NAELO|nr:uncharacterized protein C9374_009499 [Naegleria lovaniensis]KAG2392922.1 hypothetical protein C9374_009499 [Naegleria lovaniensis]